MLNRLSRFCTGLGSFSPWVGVGEVFGNQDSKLAQLLRCTPNTRHTGSVEFNDDENLQLLFNDDKNLQLPFLFFAANEAHHPIKLAVKHHIFSRLSPRSQDSNPYYNISNIFQLNFYSFTYIRHGSSVGTSVTRGEWHSDVVESRVQRKFWRRGELFPLHGKSRGYPFERAAFTVIIHTCFHLSGLN